MAVDAADEALGLLGAELTRRDDAGGLRDGGRCRRADNGEGLMADLQVVDLHGSLTDRTLNSMNFLNEVSHHYPDAISLAAGRPSEEFYSFEDLHSLPGHVRGATCATTSGTTRRPCGGRSSSTGGPRASSTTWSPATSRSTRASRSTPSRSCHRRLPGSDGPRTAGAPGRPAGRPARVSPAYVGITGAARLVDLPVLPVAGGNDGVDLDDLVAVVKAARAEGLRPRACYVMPDFANPSGLSLDLETRQRLLDVAAEQDLLAARGQPVRAVPGRRRGAGADAEVARHRAAGDLPRLLRQDRAARRSGRLRGRRSDGCCRGRIGRSARRRAVEDQEHGHGQHLARSRRR